MLKRLNTILLTLTLINPGIAAEYTIGGINHFGLAVSDLQASQDFFVDTLGFDVVGGDSDYPSVFVANSEIMVTLWRVTDPVSAVAFDRKNNVGLHHLAFNVGSFSGLDALYAILLNTPDVVIEFSPEFLGDGPAKHMMVLEPSGNRLEFIHNPPR